VTSARFEVGHGTAIGGLAGNSASSLLLLLLHQQHCDVNASQLLKPVMPCVAAVVG